MNIERAKELAIAAHPQNPTAKFFFITTDELVHTNPNDAVMQAVKLSAGNPEVVTVSADELDLPKLEQTDFVTNDTVTAARLTAIAEMEKKIKALCAEILPLENDEEINEENHAAKMHVAQLKKQLFNYCNEYKDFFVIENNFDVKECELFYRVFTTVVETPLAPVVETPATPIVEIPATPVVETPATPVVETPATPVVETPATPVVDPKPKPITQKKHNADNGNKA